MACSQYVKGTVLADILCIYEFQNHENTNLHIQNSTELLQARTHQSCMMVKYTTGTPHLTAHFLTFLRLGLTIFYQENRIL